MDIIFFGCWLEELFVDFFGFYDNDEFVGYDVFLRFFIYGLKKRFNRKVGDIWVYEFI